MFKTTADPFVGRLTYLRVLSGTLKSQAHVWNTTRDEDERIGQLLLLHGKEQEPIGELKAGEIGAVAKLTVTETGDTLATKERWLRLPPLDFPEPSLIVAIEPVSKSDLDKMGPALARMLEEEPTVRLERTALGEQILRTMGEAHTAVIIERLKRKFGAAVATHTPKVPYKETIRGTTKVHGRYKKQTGGHGMFGDVWIELEPNPGRRRRVRREDRRRFRAEGLLRRASRRASARPRPRASSPAIPCPTSRRRSTTARSTRSTRTSCRSRSPHRWPSRTASTRPSPPCSSRSWPSRSGSPRRTWARSTATSTADAAGSSAWTRTTACRSSARTCPRRSCSATRRSCARSPRAAARSRRRSTTTRTCPSHIAEKVIEAHRKELEAAGGHGGGHWTRRYGIDRHVGGAHASAAELAEAAEAAGWDGVFTWDGIALGPMETYDPWVTMAAMAMRTERVTLGSIVTPPSRRRPWKLAREAMSRRPAVRRPARPAGRPGRAR